MSSNDEEATDQNRPRRVARFWLIGLVVLCAPMIAWGAWRTWRDWLSPLEPATASRESLVRWLCTNDAAEQESAFQNELFTRCYAEVLSPDSTVDWTELAAALRTLSETQFARWRNNLAWLGRSWWRQEALTYHEQPREKQTEYLYARLKVLVRREFPCLLRVYRLSSDVETVAAQETGELLKTATREIEAWIALSAPAEQRVMRAFWGAVQWQFFTRPDLWRAADGDVKRPG